MTCCAKPLDPASKGPFNVGYKTWSVLYTPPGETAERSIAMDLWYPTDSKAKGGVTYFGLINDDGAIPDAEPASGSFPLHVHSHGSQAFAGSSYRLMRHFASHGWVVIAPTHSGNTLADPAPPPDAIFELRAHDVSKAIDVAAELELDVRTDKVLVSGHSYGGRTAWAVAGAVPELRDSRVVAGIVMASALTPQLTPQGCDDVTVPMFLMSGTDDPVGQASQWASFTRGDRTWIDIDGGCHQLFALGGCPKVPDNEGFAIVNTYGLAFGARHVLGDRSVDDVLSGKRNVSSRVAFSQR